MNVAIATENRAVYQHFGQCPQYKSGIEAVLCVAGPFEIVAGQYVQGTLQQGVSTCERGLFHHDGCSPE
jgi:hypothetical protein